MFVNLQTRVRVYSPFSTFKYFKHSQGSDPAPAPAPDDELLKKHMICSWSDQLAVILRQNDQESEESTAVAQGCEPSSLVPEMQSPLQLSIQHGRSEHVETLSEAPRIVESDSREDVLVEVETEEGDLSTSILEFSIPREGFRNLEIVIRFG